MNNNDNKINLFEGLPIRKEWDNENEKWWFSVVDVVGILTEQATSKSASTYWAVLKKRLIDEGAEQLLTNCKQLKLTAADGKKYLTDVADIEQMFRIIQSIPSKKAEPIKQWLAKVGSERIDETINPELSMQRAIETYRRKGYPEEWINQRMKTIKIRNELTSEWKKGGVSESEDFAKITNEMTKTWSGKSVREYKDYKGLKNEDLRDNMTDLELIINTLAETVAKEISKSKNPHGYRDNLDVALEGAEIAKNTRKQVEEKTGKPVVSKLNAKDYPKNQLINDSDEDE